MSRNTTASVTSAAAATQLRYRVLLEISSLTGGTVRACTGNNYIVVGANTYSPVGAMGGIESVQEDPDGFPRALRAWISVVNSVAMQAALTETLFMRRLDVSRCFLSDSYTVVGTPQLAFRGNIDKAELSLMDPDKGNFLAIEAESKLYQSGRSYYLNRETLQTVMAYSSDTFFDFVTKIPMTKSDWGNHDVILSNYQPPPRTTGRTHGRGGRP